MRLLRAVTVLSVLIVLTGCLPLSVQPFYTQDQLVFDEGLLGEWRVATANADPLTWRFSREGNQTYFLHITDNQGRTAVFHARLFKLGERQWLDILFKEHDPAIEMSDWMKMTVVPLHALLSLERQGDDLSLVFINYDYLEAEALGSDHMSVLGEQRVLFTGTTARTQQWLTQQAGKQGFLNEQKISFSRVEEKPATP